jgi:hypothetical protein
MTGSARRDRPACRSNGRATRTDRVTAFLVMLFLAKSKILSLASKEFVLKIHHKMLNETLKLAVVFWGRIAQFDTEELPKKSIIFVFNFVHY